MSKLLISGVAVLSLTTGCIISSGGDDGATVTAQYALVELESVTIDNGTMPTTTPRTLVTPQCAAGELVAIVAKPSAGPDLVTIDACSPTGIVTSGLLPPDIYQVWFELLENDTATVASTLSFSQEVVISDTDIVLGAADTFELPTNAGYAQTAWNILDDGNGDAVVSCDQIDDLNPNVTTAPGDMIFQSCGPNDIDCNAAMPEYTLDYAPCTDNFLRTGLIPAGTRGASLQTLSSISDFDLGPAGTKYILANDLTVAQGGVNDFGLQMYLVSEFCEDFEGNPDCI